MTDLSPVAAAQTRSARRRATLWRPPEPVDIDKLQTFITTSMPGDTLQYYRGRLDIAIDNDANDDARQVKELAFTAAGGGYFDLIQQRLGEDDYSYVIRRRLRKDDGFLIPVTRYPAGSRE